jgi:hypothetical protein
MSEIGWVFASSSLNLRMKRFSQHFIMMETTYNATTLIRPVNMSVDYYALV